MGDFNLKMLLLLSFGHLATDIYSGALPATLPFLKENLSLSFTMTGVILMVSNFTSSLIQPLFGYYSDMRGKPFLLPLGCLFAGIGFALLSIPSSYTVVLALVIISGLGIASFHPEGYKSAAHFTGERPVTGMAVFSVGGSLGMALGPIITVFIIEHFRFSSLSMIIIPSLLFTMAILISWKQIMKGEAARSVQKKASQKIPRTAYLSVSLLIGIVIMRSWIQMGLMSYIPFYYINYLKGDPLYASALVSGFLLGGVLGTLGGAPVADRLGHKPYLTLSMLLVTLMLPLVFITNGLTLFIVLGLLGIILLSTFSVTIVMSHDLLPHNLGTASGLMVGFATGAGGICVTLLGVIADHFGVPFALRSIAVLPLLGLGLTLMLRLPDQRAAI